MVKRECVLTMNHKNRWVAELGRRYPQFGGDAELKTALKVQILSYLQQKIVKWRVIGAPVQVQVLSWLQKKALCQALGKERR